jgi:histone H3/H4
MANKTEIKNILMSVTHEWCGIVTHPSGVRKNAIAALQEYDGDLEQLAYAAFDVTYHAARRVITLMDVLMAIENIKNPPEYLFEFLRKQSQVV